MDVWVALIGLLGVLVGGGIGAAGSWVASRTDIQGRREDWVRDQRLDVYERFRREWNKLSIGAWTNYNEYEGAPPPDDAIVPLYELVEEVELVGPPVVQQRARAATDALSSYTYSGKSVDRKQAEEAFSTLASAMRETLGFSTSGGLKR